MTDKASSPIANPLPAYQAADENEFISLSRSALNNYNQQVVKQFGFLDNQGIALDDDEGGEGAVHIDSLYVVPFVTEKRLAPEVMAQEESDKEQQSEQELLKVVQVIWKTPRLTLMGDPGVGKTTLTQWLMCSLCHPSDNYAKQNLGQLFPLLLTARKLKTELTQSQLSVQGFIETIINTQAECLSKELLGADKTKAMECLLACFERGQVLLIIDGLDEISTDAAHWLQTQLRQLLTQYSKIRLLMTSRVVGFDALEFWRVKSNIQIAFESLEVEPIDESEKRRLSLALVEKSELQQANLPSDYYLAPFIPSQRHQFATNWVNHYLPPVEEKRHSFMQSMDNVSNHSIQLNALSRIPVLLNLICFVLWRRGKLPDGRAELYQDIVRTYLTTMDKSRGIKHELGDEYDYQDIKTWLGKLALQMHCGDLVVADNLAAMDEDEREALTEQLPEVEEERLLQVSETQLQQFLQLQLSEVVDCKQLATHSKQLIDYLQTRTGFLIPKGQLNGEEQFGFSHLSFQEYFTAYAISLNTHFLNPEDKFGAKLIKTTYNPAWGEVWQLVFEQLSLAGSHRKAIADLLNRVFTGNFNYHVRLALYCKIVLNPAIKLVANTRNKFKIEIICVYLTNFGSVRHIDVLVAEFYQNNKLKPTLLAALTNNERLFFDDKQLPVGLVNDCLAQLEQYNQLTDLRVNGAIVENYRWLNRCHQLDTLVIDNMPALSAADLVELTNLTQLRQLSLMNSALTKFGWLKHFNQLTYLNLSGSEFGRLADLKHLQQLTSLIINNCLITNLTNLPELPKLEVLQIDQRVADNSPNEVATLKNKGVDVLVRMYVH